MGAVFSWKDADESRMTVAPRTGGGVVFMVGSQSCHLNDAEIPDLISALQDYMSRRAKELTKGAGK